MTSCGLLPSAFIIHIPLVWTIEVHEMCEASGDQEGSKLLPEEDVRVVRVLVLGSQVLSW